MAIKENMENVTLEERKKFIENVQMKDDFTFKLIWDFKDEIAELANYIERKGLDWNNRIADGRYSKTHHSVEQIKIISIENNKQIEEPYIIFNNRVDPELINLCMPIVTKLEELYSGKVCECLINKLDAHSLIPTHTDTEGYMVSGEIALGLYYRLIRRIHVPIFTNKDVFFKVAGEVKSFKVGECWETNTDQMHSVWNNSDVPRYHLIFDVLPYKWL